MCCCYCLPCYDCYALPLIVEINALPRDWTHTLFSMSYNMNASANHEPFLEQVQL